MDRIKTQAKGGILSILSIPVFFGLGQGLQGLGAGMRYQNTAR